MHVTYANLKVGSLPTSSCIFLGIEIRGSCICHESQANRAKLQDRVDLLFMGIYFDMVYCG